MIKAIVFDLAGVLYYPGTFKKFARGLNERSGVSYKTIRKAHRTIWYDWKSGKISDKKAYLKVKEEFNLNTKTLSWFKKAIKTEFWINKSLFNMIAKLKDYELYVLSNNINDIINPLVKRHNLDKIFKKIYISQKIKLVKPEKKIFKYFLKETKHKPEECIFIDNELRNIDAAKSLGFKTIHYKNIKDFKLELKKLKVL
ncbi:HAD-IA family hydrolase [Candidatus Woesearchaeota archaeon]|nr:HAD-IA family hydrolase [Candidatus Woesearchaeota archaeon]